MSYEIRAFQMVSEANRSRTPRSKRERPSSMTDHGKHADVDGAQLNRMKRERDLPASVDAGANEGTGDAKLSAGVDSSLSQPLSSTALQQLTHAIIRLPTLLDLPREIRHRIYRFLIPESPLRLIRVSKHKSVALREQMTAQNDRTHSSLYQNSDYANLTRVCRVIRTEYFPYFLGQVNITIDLDLINHHAICFGPVFKCCKASLIVTFDPTRAKTCTELLPLLRLSSDAPSLTIHFVVSRKPHTLAFDLTMALDLDYFIDLCRQNKTWRQCLNKSIASVTLYPRDRFEANLGSRCSSTEPCLQVDFVKVAKESWMSGTHSFEDLQAFLTKTGLDRLTMMDVRVGLASMRNEGRGKGLRTQEQCDVIDWLLGRSSQAPSMKIL